MKCPYCNSADSQVKDSRPSELDGTIRRRRICSTCGARFTTVERVQMRDLMVTKNNGMAEPFDRDKLAKSVKIACHNCNISEEQLDKIANSIYRRIESEAPEDTISSEYIGQLASEALLNLDPIAYIRFVSVHKKFTRVADFKKLLSKIPEPEDPSQSCDLPKPKKNSLF
jgi:transcriptional repressor NrdR